MFQTTNQIIVSCSMMRNPSEDPLSPALQSCGWYDSTRPRPGGLQVGDGQGLGPSEPVGPVGSVVFFGVFRCLESKLDFMGNYGWEFLFHLFSLNQSIDKTSWRKRNETGMFRTMFRAHPLLSVHRCKQAWSPGICADSPCCGAALEACTGIRWSYPTQLQYTFDDLYIYVHYYLSPIQSKSISWVDTRLLGRPWHWKTKMVPYKPISFLLQHDQFLIMSKYM